MLNVPSTDVIFPVTRTESAVYTDTVANSTGSLFEESITLPEIFPASSSVIPCTLAVCIKKQSSAAIKRRMFLVDSNDNMYLRQESPFLCNR
jgi:hypothetical protein